MADETETNEGTESEEAKKPEVKTLTQEEINKLIEGARKQEKDKLYGTIEELKTQLTGLSEAQKKDKEEKDRLAQEAAAKAEEERTAKLSVEDRMTEQFRKFEERLAASDQKNQELQQKLNDSEQRVELERYKSELLASAGDEILKELVSGNTKEELANSVENAKAKYQQYFAAAVKTAEGDPGRKIKEAGAKMPNPANPDPDPVDEEGLRGLIPNIDPIQSGSGKVNEEYLKNRDAILARVGNAYGKSA